MSHSRTLLEHSIVGQNLLTNFQFNKDRPYAGCRICGMIFQPKSTVAELDQHAQIARWRERHNKTHRVKEHLDLAHSGLTLTPEAAWKMAPYGIVPVADADVDEIAQALKEASRAPSEEIHTTLPISIRVSKEV